MCFCGRISLVPHIKVADVNVSVLRKVEILLCDENTFLKEVLVDCFTICARDEHVGGYLAVVELLEDVEAKRWRMRYSDADRVKRRKGRQWIVASSWRSSWNCRRSN